MVFVALFAPLVTLMRGHDGSMTAIKHYFEGTVPHFPLYSSYDDHTALLLLQFKFWLDCTQCVVLGIVVSDISLHFTTKIAKSETNHLFPICRLLHSLFCRWQRPLQRRSAALSLPHAALNN